VDALVRGEVVGAAKFDQCRDVGTQRSRPQVQQQARSRPGGRGDEELAPGGGRVGDEQDIRAKQGVVGGTRRSAAEREVSDLRRSLGMGVHRKSEHTDKGVELHGFTVRVEKLDGPRRWG
jgi:hypothetical protein